MNRRPSVDLAAELEAIGQGDMDAMRRLHDATSSKLFAVCLAIVNDRPAAEDVLQEVYIKIWNRAQGFDRGRGLPLPWLAMMARNSAIDFVRAQARHRHADAAALEQVPDHAEPVDEALARQEQAELAVSSIDELDDGLQALIHDAFIRGLTYAELADRRDLPLGTVKSRIRRGLLRLRQSMVHD